MCIPHISQNIAVVAFFFENLDSQSIIGLCEYNFTTNSKYEIRRICTHGNWWTKESKIKLN